MIFNVSTLKNEKWFAREQVTMQVSFYLGSLLWKNVNPTYTLCRLQKTQNLKFLQNLAGFWIFEFSMAISQTWYFNKYIHRINVAFVNRDTQNFQLMLFWPKKAENNPKVLTQKKVHFMRSIFPKCKVRANFAFLSK